MDADLKQLHKQLFDLRTKLQGQETVSFCNQITRQKMGAIEMNVMNQIANKREETTMCAIIKGII